VSVQVGELTIERALFALGGEQPSIIYSDPPWGPGNLLYWRTHNAETERPCWSDFLRRFCAVASSVIAPSGHIFVEMGLRWVDDLAEEMARVGLAERHRWTCYYGAQKLPNALWYSGPGSTTNPEGLSGVTMTRRALEGVSTPGALVFDPCCGKGMTARCAVRLGMRFAGIELNPKRAAVTQSWLNRQSTQREQCA